jgi:dihydrolipoamide dehydrogenase
VASVGLTEKQATEQGFKIITAKCPFLANGKAMAMENNSGFVKIVAEKKSKKILGVHMLGSHVTELVAGTTTMIKMNGDAAQLGEVVHPHPTLSEGIMEAAHKLCGNAIHI